MQQPNTWTCERCGAKVSPEDAFTLTKAGPKYSFLLLCEPCADAVLEIYRTTQDYLAWKANNPDVVPC